MAFTVCAPSPQSRLTEQFHELRLPDDRVWSTFHRHGNGYLVRFPDLADFWVSNDGSSVTCTPVPGTPESSLRHLYHGQVYGLAESRRGKLSLHASAVALDGDRCVAFCGASGAGKSTLAASFAGEGCAFLTDDVLSLRMSESRVIAEPSHPALRLWGDSAGALLDDAHPRDEAAHYTSKSRVLATRGLPHCADDRSLAALFLISGSDDAIGVEPLKQTDSMAQLLRQSFLLDMHDQQAVTDHFARLADLLESVPCFALRYPRSYSALPDVRDAVRKTVSAVAG